MADEQRQMVRVEVLAQLFDLSVEQIYRITKEGVIKSEQIPGGGSMRQYPFIESIKAYISYLKDKDAKRNELNNMKTEADLAKKELELRRLETQISLEEGRAHDESIVRSVWNDVMGSFKVRLWNLSYTAAERLVDIPDREKVSEILREEIGDLCSLLTGYDPAAFFARHPEFDDDENDGEEGDTIDEAEDAV